MNTLGWQIGAFLIGASALIIAVYIGKLLNTTNKVVEKVYKIIDYNERHIHETIENVASITTYTEEIVSMVSKITNITKVFRFVKRRMSMNIDSKLNNENGFWDVSLQGELDVSTADKLKAHLHNLADEKILDMKINLENLDYIDSTGLGAMIGVLKKLKTDNKEIYIINPKSNVKKIFTITGLDKIFKVEG